MKNLDMDGPFVLTQEVIDDIIPEGLPGNYAYGYIDETDNSFVVQYVGRSDTNLKERICHGIGQYEWFKASIANSAQDAFYKECRNYHDFGGEEGFLDNKIHPAKPERGLGFCPICSKRILDKLMNRK